MMSEDLLKAKFNFIKICYELGIENCERDNIVRS